MHGQNHIKCCDVESDRPLIITKWVSEVRKMWPRKTKKYNIAFSQNCYEKSAWRVCYCNLQENPIARNINI